MKVRLFFWLALASLCMAACSPSRAQPGASNPPAQSAPASLPLEATTAPATPTVEPPTLTATPAATATASATPTPTGPLGTILSNNTSCMSGPDVGYQVVDTLNSGQVGQIIGRDDNMNWLQIRDPNNASVSCWVPSIIVTAIGDVASAQVVMPPMGMITKVSINSAVTIDACPGKSKIRFNATITTTSWAIVNYYWTVKGPILATIGGGQTTFKTGGANTISGNIERAMPCGVYKITLHVTNPITVSVTSTVALK